MIFVTVGTHEQQFNRLIEKVDALVGKGVISEPVRMQTGFSEYVPRHCDWKKLIPYDEMIQIVKDARIVITHGGPASFIMPLQYGKTPVVVPRKLEFGEHVNNHQVEFVQAVSERMNQIIPVYDIEDLEHTVLHYDEICKNMNQGTASNNAKFNQNLEQIVSELF